MTQQITTLRAGLIGEGIGPSLSPPMHEREGKRHQMHYSYQRMEFSAETGTVQQLHRLLERSRQAGFIGVNITYPAKHAVLTLLDELAPSAQLVGAVNTVVFTETAMIGHNTDVSGFRASLDDALGHRPSGRVVLIGAGGAGSAVAHALVLRGVHGLTLIDPAQHKISALQESLLHQYGFHAEAAPPEELAQHAASAAGIINATPIGMAHHPGVPFDTSLIHSGHWVADVVYRPAETQLLRHARAAGAMAIAGTGMAMHQAADAFEIFTGEQANRAAMLADLSELLTAEGLPAEQAAAVLRPPLTTTSDNTLEHATSHAGKEQK